MTKVRSVCRTRNSPVSEFSHIAKDTNSQRYKFAVRYVQAHDFQPSRTVLRTAVATVGHAGARGREVPHSLRPDLRSLRMTELTNLPAHWTSLPGRTLKAGGQATVFPIRHDDGREGVFREMRLSPSQAERDRFRRELQILTGTVRHRAIVELFDWNGDIERPWYISELGNSFTSWWRHQKKQTQHDPAGLVDRAIQVLAELASALSVCHKSGVVHRDIKPNNLVVKRGVGEPWPVLIDFGIAHDEAGSRLTPLDGAVGNERFSPDVMRSRLSEVPPWLDVFDLAQLLMWMLDERAPKARWRRRYTGSTPSTATTSPRT